MSQISQSKTERYTLDEVIGNEDLFKELLNKLLSKDVSELRHIKGTSDNMGASFQEVAHIILEDSLSDEDKVILGLETEGVRHDPFR